VSVFTTAKGHSTTTWTKFYPILTTYPPWVDSCWQLLTFYMIPTLCSRDQHEFLLTSYWPLLVHIVKGTFLSEGTDVLLQTDEHFSALKLKIWILVILKAALDSQRQPSCPYKPLSFKTFSISKHFLVTKIQIFSFRAEKCSSVWSYDKNISIFWQKRTFIECSLIVRQIF
jgi:hypothetical protein